MHASRHDVVVDVPSVGRVFFAPCVVILVVDHVEERGLLGLMGHGSMFHCSHFLARRHSSCDIDGPGGASRPVVATLQAHLEGAEARLESGRPRFRAAPPRMTSALPFAPLLGAIHGFGTGDANLYWIVSFDTQHVWKLGVLRLIAQRLPVMLQNVCEEGRAIHGTVPETMLAVNMRSFELGRMCRAAPVSPE